MDDIKLYVGSKKRIKLLSFFSTDIHIDFGVEKCRILFMQRGKIIIGDKAQLNGNIIRIIDIGETNKVKS